MGRLVDLGEIGGNEFWTSGEGAGRGKRKFVRVLMRVEGSIMKWMSDGI